MPKIAVIAKDEDLILALQAYVRYFKLDLEVVCFNKDIKPTTIDLIVTINLDPELLDGLRFLISLRAQPLYIAIPVIFLSDSLSEAGQILYKDVEFIDQAELPFKSDKFFELCFKKFEWMESNRELLNNRRKIEATIKAKYVEDSLSLLEVIEASYENEFALACLRAKVHQVCQNYDKAIEHAQSAVSLHNESLLAHNLLSSSYMLAGDRARAVDAVNRCAKLSELQLKNLLHWGDVYMERGNGKKAAFSYDTALKSDAELKEAKEGKLAADILQGKQQLVEETLIDSPISRELARICNIRAISMVAKGSYGSAEMLYTNAMKFLASDEEKYKLWLNLGLAMKKKKDYSSAIIYFGKGRDVQPPGYERFNEQILHSKKLLDQESAKILSSKK